MASDDQTAELASLRQRLAAAQAEAEYASDAHADLRRACSAMLDVAVAGRTVTAADVEQIHSRTIAAERVATFRAAVARAIAARVRELEEAAAPAPPPQRAAANGRAAHVAR